MEQLLFPDLLHFDVLMHMYMEQLDERMLEQAIQESNQTEQPMKKQLITTKGLEQIKIKTYDSSSSLFETNECPIMCEAFENGQDVAILPCNHCFIPDAIYKWLKTECAQCPVCRYAFDAYEVVEKN